ncbi:hypothetical protein [Fluctibacter halophilus]|nr:hypothetical protein [Aestuariibacter halophilus]
MNNVWLRAGRVVQGIVLGVFLTLALVEIALLEHGAVVFRYQGF